MGLYGKKFERDVQKAMKQKNRQKLTAALSVADKVRKILEDEATIWDDISVDIDRELPTTYHGE